MVAFSYPDWVRRPIVEAYRQGKSYNQVAELFGVSWDTVRKYVIEAKENRTKMELTQVSYIMVDDPQPRFKNSRRPTNKPNCLRKDSATASVNSLSLDVIRKPVGVDPRDGPLFLIDPSPIKTPMI